MIEYSVTGAIINRSMQIVVTFILISISSCNERKAIDEAPVTLASLVNTTHLDALFEEIIVDNDTMGIIHIYSEYPDYDWVDDDDEGTACVDDAARASIFYLNHYQYTQSETSLLKAKRLLQFVLHMQTENGLFYNFIWSDHSQNKTFKTSVAQPDWWTWRAMWALSEGVIIFKNLDQDFSASLFSSLEKATSNLLSHLPLSRDTKLVNGIEVPTWLPYESATDQAALLIISLAPYYQMTKDGLVLEYVKSLTDGIMLMQAGDSINFPHYAFLSWENIWHAYGNSQSQALLKAGKLMDNSEIIQSALNEIKYFYPYLNEHNLIEFKISNEEEKIVLEKSSVYSQIAYNIRPMVFACLEAYRITGEEIYAKQAGEIACWLFADNIDNAQMYFPQSGICYDGITAKKTVNRNSGAESTIEALLILQAVEQNSIARKVIEDFNSKQIASESSVL
jgi:hypothetical protein